ncbi:hypothetical protein [Streptomyces sp. NRRL WC-3618]|uniref:hypothetical protein n=1 Tax=Streptomyces sp. NRRL WC-3618 TaxID=1519490 RepID=UPI0006B02040|nr:hypothetical protein [Streptomyces sp. NRRL WC-3618]
MAEQAVFGRLRFAGGVRGAGEFGGVHPQQVVEYVSAARMLCDQATAAPQVLHAFGRAEMSASSSSQISPEILALSVRCRTVMPSEVTDVLRSARRLSDGLR